MRGPVAPGSPECVETAERLELGEGPLWHPEWQELLVVDVPRGDIHRFDAGLRLKGTLALGRPTSAVTWQQDGSIICFHDQGKVSRIRRRGSAPEVVLAVPDEVGGMFNDVIADPEGRILCGALPIGQRPGRLYAVDPDGSHRILLDDLQEPNGLGFSADGRILYFADSVGQTVWRFDYDRATGTLGERTVFWRTAGNELPDGLTVDGQGRIVCAVWGGGRIVRLSPAGEILDCLSLPARRVTSVAFGGAGFDRAYVTSALQAGPEGADDEAAGAVFLLANMGQGRPEWPSRLTG